jgi:hypothetical protein
MVRFIFKFLNEVAFIQPNFKQWVTGFPFALNTSEVLLEMMFPTWPMQRGYKEAK